MFATCILFSECQNCHHCHLYQMSFVGVACEWMSSPPGILCSLSLSHTHRERETLTDRERGNDWERVSVSVCVTLSLRTCRKSIDPQLELDHLPLPSDAQALWPSKAPQTSAWDCLQMYTMSALCAPAQVSFKFYLIYFCLWLIFCACARVLKNTFGFVR